VTWDFAIKSGSFGDYWLPCEDRLGIEAGSFVGQFAVPGIASVAVTLVRDAQYARQRAGPAGEPIEP
jgi:hypothetical protein